MPCLYGITQDFRAAFRQIWDKKVFNGWLHSFGKGLTDILGDLRGSA